VIGGDQENALRFLYGRTQPAQTLVDRRHGFFSGGKKSGVAHHVGIGVIDDDQIVFAGPAMAASSLSVTSKAPLISGCQIVGRDLRTLHE
jgi:hypothetical protein